jgi:flagellar hook-basal body complex protein FliE
MIENMNLNPVHSTTSKPTAKIADIGGTDITKQFGQFLNEAMNNISTQHQETEKLTNQFIKGDLADVHQIMIASEKAAVGLQLTVQVRNKAVEAYQEIMRMQI